MKRRIFFGPPGTGKTTRLLSVLEEELRTVPAARIAFLTFTRKAKREAMERVEKVLGMVPKDLPHFRTIHSMCFKALRLRDGDVVGWAQLDAFGKTMGLTFGSNAVTEVAAEGLSSTNEGDALIALDNLARLRGCDIKRVWTEARSDIPWPTVQHFSTSYALFKKNNGLLDFTDVLAEYVLTGPPLSIEVAFIDEAQDLSSLQWKAALKACASATRQYVAGDDDQAIYRWAGAEVAEFLALEGDREVLAQSYRLPRTVHALAQRIVARIKTRVPKDFAPRAEEGTVQRHASPSSLKIAATDDWMFLVRNRYLMAGLVEHLEQRGIVYAQHGVSAIKDAEREAIYTWEKLRKGQAVDGALVTALYKLLRGRIHVDSGFKGLTFRSGITYTEQMLRAEYGLVADGPWYAVLTSIPEKRRAYYRKLLRDNGTLRTKPSVQLETIHGAKGGQADHVALFLEQSRKVWDKAREEPDEEHRVWYVGATRARQSLHVIVPEGRWAYDMPKIPGK